MKLELPLLLPAYDESSKEDLTVILIPEPEQNLHHPKALKQWKNTMKAMSKNAKHWQIHNQHVNGVMAIYTHERWTRISIVNQHTHTHTSKCRCIP